MCMERCMEICMEMCMDIAYVFFVWKPVCRDYYNFLKCLCFHTWMCSHFYQKCVTILITVFFFAKCLFVFLYMHRSLHNLIAACLFDISFCVCVCVCFFYVVFVRNVCLRVVLFFPRWMCAYEVIECEYISDYCSICLI